MIIQNKGTAVYRHISNGIVFYVGMGIGQRAFEVTRRNYLWKEVVDKNGYFEVEIISWHIDRNEAVIVEAEEIVRLKPYANIMMNGFARSDEFKSNMSIRLKGIPKTESHKQKMRESAKLRPPSHYKGRPMGEKQKTLLSELALGKIGVVNVNTGERYASLRECVRITGVNRTSLRFHLQGRLKHAGGNVYKYA
jgi:hypothetical protein